MGFLGNASGLSKVACLVLVIAFGVHCVGYATTSWMKYEDFSDSLHYVVGLWRMANCSGYHGAPCKEGPIPDSFYTTLLITTEALESCGLVTLLITGIMSGFYFASVPARVQRMAVGILAMCFISALFIAGGMVCWIFNLPDKHYPYWSMGLTLIAATLAIMAAILMIPDIRMYDYQRNKLQARKERRRRIRKARDEEKRGSQKDTKF